MSTDPDLVARLRPVRLPADFAAFDGSEVLAAAALGILAGLLLLALLHLVTRRRDTALTMARREIAAARLLPAEDRLFRQAALIDRLRRDAAPARQGSRADSVAILREDIGASLYRPGATPDLDAIDAAILTMARSRRRLRARA
ncbi:hypothetical protein [Aurantimonas coralicida]|uniref:hypothetical protein n=1 Tax=Aurantimonas coralicida TaxID=182270 RepID=UPI001E3F497F|nr:hypothetical protein [Aurantimonas coralicida]MCD1644086.1 hypothetical protein [Aurantimonas coralicida]